MAKALVLTCIDPRFISVITNHLNKEKDLHQDYDLFTLAGAELGVLEKSNWEETFYDTIDLAIKLHKIKKIICISHEDCGMYKSVYNKQNDTNLGLHQENQQKLKMHLNNKYEELSVENYVLTIDKKFIQTS